MVYPLRLTLIAILFCLAPRSGAAPVFPGAAGFGSHTVAGRGGQIYRVTNLNDRGPGSLRYGVEEIEGPRVIIFDVSGVVELSSDITVYESQRGEYGFLTIAGQTAPPPGITLKNAGLAIRANDVLVQHLAIRPGTSLDAPDGPRLGNRDAIKVEAPPGTVARHIVIDHVSCSWATDESISTYANLDGSIHDVTFIDCLVSEAVWGTRPQPGGSFGALAGRNSSNVSFIRNVLALNRSRGPLIRDTVLTAEVVNNLVYWPHYDQKAVIYFGSAHPDHPDLTLIASVAGNVIIRRPPPPGSSKPSSTVGIYLHDEMTRQVSLYMANNRLYRADTDTWHPQQTGPDLESEIVRRGRVEPKTWSSNPFPFTDSNPWSDDAASREARLLASAGKQPAFRDAVDARVLELVRTRTGEWIDRSVPPDAWNPVDIRQTRVLPLPSDPNGDADHDGYTNLEEWLHGWSAYVEGRAAEPPQPEDPAMSPATHYQTPAVKDGLPVFLQNLKDRAEHAMSWTSGRFDDFAAWKTLARERVKRAWMNPPPGAPWNPVVLAEEDRGTYVVRKIALNLTGDSRLAAYLTVPKGDGPFPAVLLLHDHGGRFEIGKEKVIRPFAAPAEMVSASETWVGRLYGGRYLADELARRGYVTFVTDAINWGERGGGGRTGQEVLASNLMHFGMSFAGLTAWEDQRAAEFLAEQPEVDRQRIASMGLSMGGHRAWQVAALSDQITAGVSICWIGTVKSMVGPGQNLTKGSSAYSMLHPGLLVDLDYPDIASLAAPKPMLFYNGRFDRLFPQSGIQEAYAKLRAVWAAQNATDRLETRTWPVEHVFNVAMQEEAFLWLDRAFGREVEE